MLVLWRFTHFARQTYVYIVVIVRFVGTAIWSPRISRTSRGIGYRQVPIIWCSILIIEMCVDELSTFASTCPFSSNQHDRTHGTLVCFQNLTASGCRADANAANSDAETTTATDCWKQQSVPENFNSPERKLLTGSEKHRNEQASTSNSRHRNQQCGSP